MAAATTQALCPGCGDRLAYVGDLQMGEIHLAILHCKAHGSFGQVSGLLEMDGHFVARIVNQRETITSPQSQPHKAPAAYRSDA